MISLAFIKKCSTGSILSETRTRLFLYQNQRTIFRRRRKKPLFIRPAIPYKKDLSERLKYPPNPNSLNARLPQGLIGTLTHLLMCFDKDYQGTKPVKDLISNPPLLSLATRSLKHKRQIFSPSKSEIVEEACFILTSFLEFVSNKTQTKGEIPPDSTLAQCLLYQSTVRTRPLIEKLLDFNFEPEDTRFLVRAIQNPKWRSRIQNRSGKCFDPSWRISTESPGLQNRTRTNFTFHRNQLMQIKDWNAMPQEELSLASVSRPRWRVLPVDDYSTTTCSWILSTTDLVNSPKNLRQTQSQNNEQFSPYCLLDEQGQRHAVSESTTVDWIHTSRRRAQLQRQLHWLLFTDVFRKVQTKFNQKVQKLKSPDTIQVVNKPAPTLMDLERRVSYEMRRMVPTIHWQKYRGIQLRNKYNTENAIALYWYNSHFKDILATLAELEYTLLKHGVRLPLSEVKEPDPVEIRRLM